MYASLPTAAQSLAFEPPPPRTRKVILATNIAETSITLPGIRYVIDTGLVKVRGYQSRIGLESLTVRPVSQANANQRMGRAGREAPGVCFRLFTETAFKGLDKEMEPEIKRYAPSFLVVEIRVTHETDVIWPL